MQTRRMKWYGGLAGLTGVLCLNLLAAEDTKSDAKASAKAQPASSNEEAAPAIPRVTLKVARDRARLMHEMYSATLDTMHHRYFHGERAMVPARALKDVFKEMERQNSTQARWISASLNPMSLDNEPTTDFEKQAAKKIAKGEDVVETIEEGYYRRAGSISLGGGCVSCHAGFFRSTPATAKFAGLIISIPVEQGTKLDNAKTSPKP